MGRLHLAWVLLIGGVVSNCAGVYLLCGLAWSLVLIGAESILIGLIIAGQS